MAVYLHIKWQRLGKYFEIAPHFVYLTGNNSRTLFWSLRMKRSLMTKGRCLISKFWNSRSFQKWWIKTTADYHPAGSISTLQTTCSHTNALMISTNKTKERPVPLSIQETYKNSACLSEFNMPVFSTPLISCGADAVLICIPTITHLEMKLDSSSWFLTAGGFAFLLWHTYCCYFTSIWIFCIIKLVGICAIGSRLKCFGKKVATIDWSTVANHLLRVTIYFYFSVLPRKHIW